MKKGTIKNCFFGLVLLVITAYLIIPFTSYKPLLPGYHEYIFTPQKYKQLKFNLSKERADLKDGFNNALTNEDRNLCIKKAKRKFKSILIDKVFPFWYGTRWNFYGTTTTPGEGSIACGYFVTTVLQDAGCDLNRTKLAQVASEKMIQALVTKNNIKSFYDKPCSVMLSAIQKEGEGVSVIGLDNHTGFLICDRKEIYFIHSTGRFPFCVIKEKASESIILKRSKAKVVGFLTKDDHFIKKWMFNK
jgi:hypothetical protein